MKDTNIETPADAKAVLQSSPLTQRLNQHRTDPIGLIDVRQPQSLYDRTAGWIAQRRGVLENLTARYGANNAMPGTGTALVFADAADKPMTEAISAFPTMASTVRAPEKSSVFSSPLPARRELADTAEKMRVSRRPAVLDQSPASPAKTSQPGHAESGDAQTQVKPNISTAKVASIAPTHTEIISRSREIRQTSASQSQLILPEKTEDSAKNKLDSDRPAPVMSSSENLRHSNELSTAKSAGPALRATPDTHAQAETRSSPKMYVRIQRRPGKAEKEIAESKELNPPPVSPASADMPLRQATSGLSEAQRTPAKSAELSAVVAHTAPIPPPVATTTLTSPAVQLSSDPQLVKPLVERRRQNGQPQNSRSQEKKADDEITSQTAVAAEIPTASSLSSSPGTVWRKSAYGASAKEIAAIGSNGGRYSALPLRIGPVNDGTQVVARQDTSAPSSTAAPATASASTESAAPSAPTPTREIDVGQLAERVKRLLLRQLAVERERRGIGRWN